MRRIIKIKNSKSTSPNSDSPPSLQLPLLPNAETPNYIFLLEYKKGLGLIVLHPIYFAYTFLFSEITLP
jgi:hypothetical protein